MDTSNQEETRCPADKGDGSATPHTKTECNKHILPMKDALDVLGGKWKLMIIAALLQGGARRFKELQRDLGGITGKVLSKELKDLEEHKILTRTVYDTSPITVEYELTAYGKTLKEAMLALHKWGTEHRKYIMST